jgi:hypothetical protein
MKLALMKLALMKLALMKLALKKCPSALPACRTASAERRSS